MVMPDAVDPREAFSLVYGTGISLDPFASFDEVRYQLPADLSDCLYGSEYEGATAVLTTADSEPERPLILLWSILAGTLLLVVIVHLRRRFKLGQ